MTSSVRGKKSIPVKIKNNKLAIIGNALLTIAPPICRSALGSLDVNILFFEISICSGVISRLSLESKFDFFYQLLLDISSGFFIDSRKANIIFRLIAYLFSFLHSVFQISFFFWRTTGSTDIICPII